ncbi:MAG: hypothetical protein Q4A74_00180 [Cardiobacteriaceae bacterium]|nr:hypothetical protein [Cardiobacteriaceae bacterium]
MDEIEQIVNSYVERANKLGVNDVANLLTDSLGRMRLAILSVEILEEAKSEEANG